MPRAVGLRRNLWDERELAAGGSRPIHVKVTRNFLGPGRDFKNKNFICQDELDLTIPWPSGTRPVAALWTALGNYASPMYYDPNRPHYRYRLSCLYDAEAYSRTNDHRACRIESLAAAERATLSGAYAAEFRAIT
jgi:hypothetical protein